MLLFYICSKELTDSNKKIIVTIITMLSKFIDMNLMIIIYSTFL